MLHRKHGRFAALEPPRLPCCSQESPVLPRAGDLCEAVLPSLFLAR